MRNKKLILTILSASLFLAGCGASETETIQKNESTSTEASWTETAIQKSLCDNVTVDAQIVVPEGFAGKANVYEANVEGIQEDLVWNTLGIEKEKTTQVAEGLYTYNENFVEFSGAMAGSFVFTTSEGENYKTYDTYDASESNVSNVGENVELTFMGKQDAENSVKEMLSQMGIGEAEVTHTYALPVAYHQYVENTEIESGLLETSEQLGEQWNSLGDCYEIQLTTQYDEIPLCEEGYVAADDSCVDGGKITAIISSKGVQELEIPNQYVVNEENAQEKNILPAEQILEKLKTKMENIILTDEYTVTELKLCYYPEIINKEEGKFQLIPVWEIMLNGKEDGEISYFFQAEDGTEI